MDNQELQNKIDELSRVVKTQGEQIVALENKPIRLDRYLDNSSKDIMGDIISDRIIDIVWDKYFYYFSTFESADAWDVISNAAAPIQGAGLTLETTAVADNRSSAAEYVKFQKVMSFDEESRFRTLFYLDINSTAADIDYSMSIGSGIPTPLSNRYGFRLEDNKLYGITSNGSSETKVELLTTDVDQGGGIEAFIYLVEARNYPGKKVDFYVSDAGQATLKFKGSSTTNLPSGSSGTSISFDLYTRTTTAKRAFIDFVEYIQVRPIR